MSDGSRLGQWGRWKALLSHGDVEPVIGPGQVSGVSCHWVLGWALSLGSGVTADKARASVSSRVKQAPSLLWW